MVILISALILSVEAMLGIAPGTNLDANQQMLVNQQVNQMVVQQQSQGSIVVIDTNEVN